VDVLLRVRATVRWVAGISTGLALLGTAYGLVKEVPFDTTHIWLALVALLIIVGYWLNLETKIGCTQQIIAAQPNARLIVAACLQAEEEEAARQANLPQIQYGERLR
jgi:hypothetical protein